MLSQGILRTCDYAERSDAADKRAIANDGARLQLIRVFGVKEPSA
jgi:hypothetical protein